MIRHSFAFLFLLFVISCTRQEKAPDVSAISISPQLVRFEQELFEGDTQQLTTLTDQLSVKYPEFTDVFFNRIIANPETDVDITQATRYFVRDSFIQVLYKDCQALYQDFSPFEAQLLQSLKYFKYYFPDKPTPDIYTCITGFEYGSFTIGDNILAIGLDFYLGEDYLNYHPDLFPAYITTTMTKDFLVSKSIQSLIANYLGESKGNRLIDYMIRNGVELFIKKKLLPDAADEVIFEFSSDQLDWLKSNESEIWAYLLQQELLLSTNYRGFQKIISPSPNVPGMPPDAPGRLGNWIGERIVDRFVARNPEISLSELMQMNDAQKIMAESKYRPRQ